MDPRATLRIPVRREPDGLSALDDVAVEEPLEIRIGSEPLAVLMRTPGRDLDLAAGFLLAEGIIDGPDDLVALGPCADPSRPNAHNIVIVSLASGCAPRVARVARSFAATSSCGVCGKATIDSILQHVRPHEAFATIPAALVRDAARRVEAGQEGFRRTGGLHAAALFEGAGELTAVAEDVGRHNAVDKVCGAALRGGRVPLDGATLWVSGRASFEVVQKAAMAGAAAVVCVGAPSSLAVSLAGECRLTLVGFARGKRFNVYTGAVTP